MSESAAAVEPVERYAPARYDALTDITFAPEGDAIYVVELEYAVHIGRLLAGIWPEFLFLATLVALLIVGLRVRRAYRRSQGTVGQPHCSGCDYNLSGLFEPAQCPECGKALDRAAIRFPRPFSWRRAVVMLGLPLAFGLMVLASVGLFGRHSTFSWIIMDAVDVHSKTLFRLDQGAGTNMLTDFAIPSSRLIAVDPNADERRVMHHQDHAYIDRIFARDDGLILLRSSDSLTVLQSDSGRDRPDATIHIWRYGLDQVSTFFDSPDDDHLYFIDQDGRIRRSGAPADERSHEWPRHGPSLSNFYDVDLRRSGWPSSGPIHALFEPSDGDIVWATRDGREYRSWDLSDGSESHTVRLRGGRIRDIAETEEGRTAYITTFDPASQASGRIEVWNMRAGTFEREIQGPGDPPLRSVTLTPEGGYLFASEADPPHTIHIRDIDAEQWIATLEPPAGTEWMGELNINPAGDRLAAITYAQDRFRVVTWDIAAWDDSDRGRADDTEASDQP